MIRAVGLSDKGAFLTTAEDLDTAARQIIDTAFDHGSRDNVTVLLVQCDGEAW